MTDQKDSFTVSFKDGMTAEDKQFIRFAVLHLVSALECSVAANANGAIGVRATRNRGKFGNLRKVTELEM